MLPLDHLNRALFRGMAAGYAPEPHLLTLSHWLAVYAIAAVPVTLVLLWWLRPGTRTTLLSAAASGAAALAATELISAAIALPRPFMLHLSPVYLAHAADGSFPSAHASLMLASAGTLLLTRPTAAWGAGLLALGLATAWARVYLGLHFPLDILGSALLSAVTAAAIGREARGWAGAPARFLGGDWKGRLVPGPGAR